MPYRLLIVWLLPGCLSYDTFADQVVDKKCEENARCSPSNNGLDCLSFEVPGAEDCDFDRGAANRCLNEEWVCNESQPGFEFAESPGACEIVCVRAVDIGDL